MAQLEAMKRYVNSPRGRTSTQTMEQLLHGVDPSWAAHTSPTFSKNRDHEEHDHHTKKSVLTKVKEKAKKLKHTLSKKRLGHDDNATPAWGVSLDNDEYNDDNEDADAEYYGAPMYESAQAPDDVKQTAKQHPREELVIAENHVLSNISPRKEQVQNHKPSMKITEYVVERPAPKETISSWEKISERLAPIETISSSQKFEKPAPIEISSPSKTTPKSVRQKPSPSGTLLNSAKPTLEAIRDSVVSEDTTPTSKTITETVTEKLAPAYAMATEATGMITSKIHDMAIATSAALSPKGLPKDETSSKEKKYDKGVSVKEYLKQKVEPGEDEKALSQVITEAISPRTETPKKEASKGVAEKVRRALSPYLATEEPSPPMRSNTSSNVPLSANAYEVAEEENKGRILQAN